jgi:hypothetical protein
MRILFDQGTPVPLRNVLIGHEVGTAFEMGWSELDNGELLAAAEASFDAFITTDQSLRYQQNLPSRRSAFSSSQRPAGHESESTPAGSWRPWRC